MFRVALALIVLLPLAGQSTAAPRLGELLAAGELEASIVIDSEAPFYQRAPVVLAVEIATPRWFSRGTRVQDFRIPGAVALPVSNFANNLTQNRNGESWTVQRWRFRVFAQDAGSLAIPDLQVFVSVSHDSGETIEGELTLSHPPLAIEAPPNLPPDERWLAASALNVEERWEGEHDNYQVGDALTRVRSIAAADAPGMMIPASLTAAVDGLSLYAAPPRISDQSNRGRLTGVREERLVVTLERAGEYNIPGTTYHWFDTKSGGFRSEVLPAYSIVVSAMPGVVDDEGKSTPDLQSWAANAGWILVSCALLWLLIVLNGRVPWPVLLAPLRRLRTRARLRKDYMNALQRGQYQNALQLLHQLLVAESAGEATLELALINDAQARQSLRRLLDAAYGDGVSGKGLTGKGLTGKGATINAAEGQQLWDATMRSTRTGDRPPPVTLALNPPSSGI